MPLLGHDKKILIYSFARLGKALYEPDLRLPCFQILPFSLQVVKAVNPIHIVMGQL